MFPAVAYGFKGAGIGSRARQHGRVVRFDSPSGPFAPVPAGVAYQVRCAEWVRLVGTEYGRLVGSVERGEVVR